jgi:hypothetical protein
VTGAVAGLLASVKSGSTTPVNLVTNPSFAANTTDWYSDETAPARDTAVFRSAPASLAYYGGDASPATYYYKNNLLTVGSRYSLSIWIRTLYAQGFFLITFQAGGTSQQISVSPSSDNLFTNYKIENVLCTVDGSMQISVVSESPAYIDDVWVVQGATAFDGSPVPPLVNVVANPSMAANIVGWDGIGNSLRDTATFRSAPASLRTYFDGDNNPYATYSQTSALVSGRKYSLSFWILNSTARTFTIQFNSSTTTVAVPASGSFQYVTFQNVPIGSTTLLYFNIYPSSGSLTTEFNIDDVAVVEGPTALQL